MDGRADDERLFSVVDWFCLKNQHECHNLLSDAPKQRSVVLRVCSAALNLHEFGLVGDVHVCMFSIYSSALQQQLQVYCMSSRMEQPQTILREKHIKYFKRCLSILPSMFSELDPNR